MQERACHEHDDLEVVRLWDCHHPQYLKLGCGISGLTKVEGFKNADVVVLLTSDSQRSYCTNLGGDWFPGLFAVNTF